MAKPCADFSVKSAQAPRPCTDRPLSRQFGGGPTEWQRAAQHWTIGEFKEGLASTRRAVCSGGCLLLYRVGQPVEQRGISAC